MVQTGKYAYSVDSEGMNYVGCYDNYDEAVEAAIKEANALNKDDSNSVVKVFVGEMMKFVPRVNVCSVIEDMQKIASDEAGEWADDYLEYINKEELKLLETMLTETFNEWAKKTKNEPNFFTIEGTCEIKVDK